MNEIQNIIKAVYEVAFKAHEGQLRSDGTPYIEHPKRVAKLVLNYVKTGSLPLVCAAFLHDVFEDSDVDQHYIELYFGSLVNSLVCELTNNKAMKDAVGSKKQYLALKMAGMSRCALIVKLCDRLDNISDMKGFSADKQKSYIEETRHIIRYLIENRELSPEHLKIIGDISGAIGDKIA